MSCRSDRRSGHIDQRIETHDGDTDQEHATSTHSPAQPAQPGDTSRDRTLTLHRLAQEQEEGPFAKTIGVIESAMADQKAELSPSDCRRAGIR